MGGQLIKINHLASKVFDLEPKQNSGVQLEYDEFAIWKWDFSYFGGQPKLGPPYGIIIRSFFNALQLVQYGVFDEDWKKNPKENF